MKECVHRKQMLPLPAEVNRGITTEREIVVKSTFELGLLVMDLAYKFEMIYLRET